MLPELLLAQFICITIYVCYVNMHQHMQNLCTPNEERTQREHTTRG